MSSLVINFIDNVSVRRAHTKRKRVCLHVL